MIGYFYMIERGYEEEEDNEKRILSNDRIRTN